MVTEESGVDGFGKIYNGTRTQYCSVCGAEVKTENYKISADEARGLYKERCSWYSYDEVARNPDDYDGSYTAFKGKVVQVINSGNSTDYKLRVNVTQGSYGIWRDTIYVEYKAQSGDPRILEDDIITLYGQMGGMESYTTVMGATVTIPFMLAVYVEYE